MLSKSELKRIFSEHRFRPSKRRGQNFLIDPNIAEKIISALAPGDDDVVVEIGPGLGALTFGLAGRCGSLAAVEKDRLLFKILRDGEAGETSGINFIQSDILDFDIAGLAAVKSVKVVGNLPFCVTTPIIEYLIRNRRSIDCAVLTVQREVAERLLAAPGGRDYGSITCFVQYHCEASYIHTINRASFYPQPEVDSSLIRLKMRAAPAVAVKDEDLLFTVIRKAFNQRRKSIMNSLVSKAMGAVAHSKAELIHSLEEVRIDPSARPEQLSLADFARISDSLRTSY